MEEKEKIINVEFIAKAEIARIVNEVLEKGLDALTPEHMRDVRHELAGLLHYSDNLTDEEIKARLHKLTEEVREKLKGEMH